MQVTVIPSDVKGSVHANPSKSHAQRAVAIAALAEGETELRDIGRSEDVTAAIEVARHICPRIERTGDTLAIHGGRRLSSRTWHCRESGFSLRAYTAIAGLFDETITLTGEGSLGTRPVDFMRAPIEKLGGRFTTSQGSLPITVTGPISAGIAEVDGALSSQFLSGLLMTLPLLEGNSQLHVNNLRSKPYVDLTLATMSSFGV
ncbi:MAG: hypothetical protein R3330_07745, partial [Saprospiraceae bacterium]|nr:hypothetical protein [Saprospiraceae bacterium]